MTRKKVFYKEAFYCICGEFKRVGGIVPLDAMLECSCGRKIRVIAKEKEDGVLWSIEEID